MTDATTTATTETNTAATTTTATTPAMSQGEAQSRYDELTGNPEWVSKYINGDVEARAEMSRVQEARISPEVIPGEAGIDVQIAGLKPHFNFSTDVEAQLRAGRTVTPQEVEGALALKENLFRDRVWVQRFHNGDREALRQSFLISVILSSKVRDAQP
jgi:hypothetical protein